jgi:PEP-CTERM motif
MWHAACLPRPSITRLPQATAHFHHLYIRNWETMLKRFFRLTRVAVALAALAWSAPAQAASLLLDIQSGTLFQRGSFANFGYTVTFDQQVRVDALGLWDYQANGLADAHPVGLWDSGGTLLAQVVVDSTSTQVAALNPAGAWWFTSIAPLLLQPGTYKVGAYYPSTSDLFISSLNVPPAQIVVNPLVTYGDSYYANGNFQYFTEPNTNAAHWDPGFFGPNAQVTAVPEPGTIALLGLGLGLARRRLKRTH